MYSSRSMRPRGVTIVELIIFMVIMGVAAAGVMGVLNLSAKSSAEPLRRKQAMMIAEALMEEVQQARFTFCQPGEANADSAAAQANCATPMVVGPRAAGATRPYGNVAEYATVINTAQRSFVIGKVNNVDVDGDINGLAFGAGANAPLAPFTSSVTLNYLNAAGALGPAGNAIQSAANNVSALLITITTTYGNGANDFVRLDAYRTRYAPTVLP